ncbi:1-acyl-sn-glycerol-3-phosphate acyltransferase [Loktanella fryxellensis]|uniref:1-acyl-sn-glycerol-3-phosphate acyltransferase n=1 Tax=Loktanella fryxellensis TaxID=245187 RepID=A0A1H8B1K4_9RHOB|nr:lysophospholipid acyltransferase family protein [Loktanella fryxellensis]SEM75984.1 1-acyl-sn-glycerol-3-phosphate acyltransferase [Loktanella fryxellensis]
MKQSGLAYGVQWLRSLAFTVVIYAMMAVVGVLFLPYALLTRDGAMNTCKMYARLVIRLARPMIGLRFEVRGTPPVTGCMIAAKHQSFMDVMFIYQLLPRPRFIMKRLLLWAPVLGLFAYKAGCIPVDRGKKGRAIKDMLARVKAGDAAPGQLCIYPQGTRVGPGQIAPYKKGTAALYADLGQPVVPVATNIGVFWPKRGIYRRPGTAVFQFLDPIPPGVPLRQFLTVLEEAIEPASDTLAREAGLAIPTRPVVVMPDEDGAPV